MKINKLIIATTMAGVIGLSSSSFAADTGVILGSMNYSKDVAIQDQINYINDRVKPLIAKAEDQVSKCVMTRFGGDLTTYTANACLTSAIEESTGQLGEAPSAALTAVVSTGEITLTTAADSAMGVLNNGCAFKSTPSAGSDAAGFIKWTRVFDCAIADSDEEAYIGPKVGFAHAPSLVTE